MATSGSEILTQKWGVTGFFSLNSRQQTPMLLIASYLAFQSAGRSGTVAETNGVGIVEMTASAGWKPSEASTPVTRPPSVTTRLAGVDRRTDPPIAAMRSTSRSTRVWLPPSI